MKIRIESSISLVLIIAILMSSFGCVTVRRVPFGEGITKQEILAGWKRNPDEVDYNPNIYGADELWIYAYPEGTKEKYYFKDNILVQNEHVTYGNF